jgi:predicted nucleic acid-binding protein
MHYEVIVDTGILLALIDRNDSHHTWVTERLKEIAPPLLTCEAVISESWFLLQRVKRGREVLLQLLAQIAIFSFTERIVIAEFLCLCLHHLID